MELCAYCIAAVFRYSGRYYADGRPFSSHRRLIEVFEQHAAGDPDAPPITDTHLNRPLSLRAAATVDGTRCCVVCASEQLLGKRF